MDPPIRQSSSDRYRVAGRKEAKAGKGPRMLNAIDVSTSVFRNPQSDVSAASLDGNLSTASGSSSRRLGWRRIRHQPSWRRVGTRHLGRSHVESPEKRSNYLATAQIWKRSLRSDAGRPARRPPLEDDLASRVR